MITAITYVKTKIIHMKMMIIYMMIIYMIIIPLQVHQREAGEGPTDKT